jgi:SPP1 gp7 family putative phage head morphogenesis protein
MPVSKKLISLETRRAVMVERAKAGIIRDKVSPQLRQLAATIRARLERGDMTALTRSRQQKLLADIGEIMAIGLQLITGAARQDMLALAVEESKFEAKALNTITPDSFESVVPAASQIRASVLAAPLSVRGTDAGRLLDPWIKSWSAFQVGQVQGVITQGFYEGRTNAQMINSVVGTMSAQYRDGDFARIKRSAEALVRTGVQHTASVARAETLKENGVDKYEWIATLDGRTSDQCQALDGQKFTFGEGPLPPIHPNCRSSITAVLPEGFEFLREDATRASIDGPVSADLSYYDWLKTQPAGFQDEALGNSWGKLFRDGGVSSQEFGKLRLGKDFKPITLADLATKDPILFDRAGL